MADTLNREIQIAGTEHPECLMVIYQEGERLIALDWSGGAEFGENYSPEAAVSVFWKSMAGLGAIDILRSVCEAHGYDVVKREGV